MLRLSLTARSSDKVMGSYRLAPGTPELARRCLRAGHREVSLEMNPTGSALADLVPEEAIDLEGRCWSAALSSRATGQGCCVTSGP